MKITFDIPDTTTAVVLEAALHAAVRENAIAVKQNAPGDRKFARAHHAAAKRLLKRFRKQIS